MRTRNLATIYAILAAALYAINIPMPKLLMNHAGATIMVKDTISLQHTHEHEHIHTHEHLHSISIE